MSDSALQIAVGLVALGLGWVLVRLGRALWTVDPAAPIVRVRGTYSPALTLLRYHQLPRLIWQPVAWQQARARLWPALEIAAIALWAGWFGQIYLNLNPSLIPAGTEFGTSIQSHYIWTLLGRCGACVFWNGFTNGGVPAFVELHGAPLHPLTVLTTLIWGPINGAKLTVVACFALAGLAQWWLARTLRLGRLARLWSAALAVASAAVASPMAVGLVSLALSSAMSALVIAACLHVARTGRRRAAVGLGVLVGLLALSGQGYLQLGLALSVLPALLILLLDRTFRLAPAWKEFLLAGILALLISAVLWVPLARFWPNLGKDSDSTFSSAQTFGATALHLVVNDVHLYSSINPVQLTVPYPFLYINYIGWVPVLVALVSLPLMAKARPRVLIFFLVAITLVFLAASASTLRALAIALPQLAAWVRNPPLIAALAVPLVLALAAWGLDLLTGLPWPRLNVRVPWRRRAPSSFALSTAWLVLALPLAWSVWSAYDFNQAWLALFRLSPAQRQVVARLKQLVPPSQTQWVELPWGEDFWLTPAMDSDVKFASYFRPWQWTGRALPPAFAEAVRLRPWPGDPAYAPVEGEFQFIIRPDQQYAAVVTNAGLVPCHATSAGGNVDVMCVTDQPGSLVVREHFWTGWSVRLDGQAAPLIPAEWLTTAAPAGRHVFTFRYRPWDVLLGLALTLAGLATATILWRRAYSVPSQDTMSSLHRDVILGS